MAWVYAGNQELRVLLGEGYLPDCKSLAAIADRWLPHCPQDQRKLETRDEGTAWLMNSLARQTFTISRIERPRLEGYRASGGVDDLVLVTWAIERSQTGDGMFDPWFEGFGDHYSLFLHAWPSVQLGQNIGHSFIMQAYEKLGIRHRPIKGTTGLKRQAVPVLEEIAESFEDSYLSQSGPSDFAAKLNGLGHPYVGSFGWPFRSPM